VFERYRDEKKQRIDKVIENGKINCGIEDFKKYYVEGKYVSIYLSSDCRACQERTRVLEQQCCALNHIVGADVFVDFEAYTPFRIFIEVAPR
jgi:hypothetical protein